MTTAITPRAALQLQALYRALLSQEARFEEFKRLVLRYPTDGDEIETLQARQDRAALNARIREWVGTFDGLSVAQTRQWRELLSDDGATAVAASGYSC
jgi:hypothetical protein